MLLRNDVAMRVDLRVAQDRGDAIFKALRDEVFQSLRFLVHLVPGVLQNIVKKEFEQSVMADEFPRAAFSRCRQANTPVFLIHNESRPLRTEPLKHSSDRRCSNSEPLGKRLGRDSQFLGAPQFEDRFEVVINRFRGRKRDGFSCHYF